MYLKPILNTVNPLGNVNIVQKHYNKEHNVWMCLRKNGKWYINNVLECKFDQRQPQTIWYEIDNYLPIEKTKEIINSIPLDTARRNQIVSISLSSYLAQFELFKSCNFIFRKLDEITQAQLRAHSFNKNILIFLMRHNLVDFAKQKGEQPNKRKHKINEQHKLRNRQRYQQSKNTKAIIKPKEKK